MEDYGKLMEKEFEKFEGNGYYPNIVLLGVTGCGKSSLINNVFGVEVAKVCDIQPETQNFETFRGKEHGTTVNLIDSKGYELEDNSESYIDRLQRKIYSMELEGEKINMVWFCLSVSKKRIEDMDLEIIKKVSEIKELKDKIFLVLTKCDEDDDEGTIAKEYKRILNDNFPQIKAYEVSNDEDLKLDYDRLIEDSVKCLDDEDLKAGFVAAQFKNLTLKKENVEKGLKKYAGMAAAVGAVPIPFSDAALLIPIQLKMVAEITEMYGMRNLATFTKGGVANLVISNLGKNLAARLIKMIPIAGSFIGGAINATVASGITYAIGKATSEICFMNCKKILNGEKVDAFDIFNSELFQNLVNTFLKETAKKKGYEEE